ncbi:MAG: AsmA family protein [Rickettsiales bacterium]|nr:AsmA family protein [Rickettsiales bacterium]
MNLKALKYALIGIGSVIAIVALALMIIPSFVDKQAVTERISKKFETLTGLPLIMGDVSISILSGAKVTVNGIALRNHPDASANYFLKADELVIHLDWIEAISSDNPKIKLVEFVAPKVELERLSDGNNNWSFLQQNKGKVDNADHVSIRITSGVVAFTHHDKEVVEDIKGINGDITFGHNQVSADLLAVHRSMQYAMAGICSFKNFEHTGHIDSDCSTEFNSGLFKLDYKGRVILADNVFKHKGSIDANIRDVRHAISLIEMNELTESELAKQSMSFSTKVESYSDGAKWIINANEFQLGESTGKGSFTYKMTKPTATANLNVWFDKMNLDQLFGEGSQRGLLTHDLFASKEGLNDKIIMDFVFRGKELTYRNAQMSNLSIMGQMMGGELILSDARAVVPGGGSIIVLGRFASDVKGLEFTGQVEGHGNKFHLIMPMLEIDSDKIPPSQLELYRTRFNLIVRPESATISELRLLINNRVQIAGGINFYFKNKRKIDATISTRYLDFDPFMKAWQGDSSMMFDPEKQKDHPFWFQWLKSYDGQIVISLEMDEYQFLDLKGRKSRMQIMIVDNQFQVNGIEMSLDRARIKGKLKLRHQEKIQRPFIDGQLSITYLNLDDMFRDTMDLQPNEEPLYGTVWSRNPINLYPLHYFDGHIDLRIRKFHHANFDMTNFRSTVKLEDYTLLFEDMRGQIWAGDFEGDMTVDSEVVPGLTLNYNIANAQMRTLFKSFVDFKNISGVMSLSGKLRFSGVSFMDWVNKISGHIAIDARNVLVQHFNLPAIVRAISSVRAISGLQNSIRLALDEGATRIGNINGTAYLADGKAQTTRIAFRSNESVGEIAGSVDLTKWLLKVAVKFGLSTLAQTNYPVLVLDFEGPVGLPERTVNTKSVEAYLARKIR